MALFAKPIPTETTVRAGGETVRVNVRVSARSRSYRLSLPHGGAPVLTVPQRGRWSEAQAFLDRQGPWLAARLRRAVPAVHFADGQTISLRGAPHRIVATGVARGRVAEAEENGTALLLVPGSAGHLPRRLLDWLKAEAKADLETRCAVHAAALGVSVRAIAMRSQATRWGSCSSAGRLNFNWRLILAPPFVLDYVAAHEVAHLVEMNHSEAFWRAVERALPDMARGRAWLRAHGKTLMAYEG